MGYSSEQVLINSIESLQHAFCAQEQNTLFALWWAILHFTKVMDFSIEASLPVFVPLQNWSILITTPLLITVSVPMPSVRADLPAPLTVVN